MQVNISNNGIIIVPETDFEEQFLCANYGNGYTYKAWLKHGSSSTDVKGLKVTTEAVEK